MTISTTIMDGLSGLAGSSIFVILIKWITTGGIFNIRIHKFDRRINITTKLLENDFIKHDNNIKNDCLKIINRALFGIEYHVDCAEKQKILLLKLIDNGLSKRFIDNALKIIDGTNGKLRKTRIFDKIFKLFILFGAISYTLLFLILILDFLFPNELNQFLVKYANILQTKIILVIIIGMIVLLYQYYNLYQQRIISSSYTEEGDPEVNKEKACKLIFW